MKASRVLTVLVLAIFFSGCAQVKSIVDSNFSDINTDGKIIVFKILESKDPRQYVNSTYLLPDIFPLNLEQTKKYFGEPTNEYKEGSSILYEFNYKNGIIKLTNYDISTEDAVYKKAGFYIEFLPNNLSVNDFLVDSVSKHLDASLGEQIVRIENKNYYIVLHTKGSRVENISNFIQSE